MGILSFQVFVLIVGTGEDIGTQSYRDRINDVKVDSIDKHEQYREILLISFRMRFNCDSVSANNRTA